MTAYEDSIRTVASKMQLPIKLVDKAYRAYWKAVRQHIMSLPLKEDLTDEEFLKLQPNVNIPSIGKLYVTLDRYHRVKKHYQICSKDNNINREDYVENKENQADAQ